MEAKQTEQAIVEVTSSLDYEAIKKFDKFWRDRASIARFLVAGILMFLPAIMFVFAAVFAEIWLLLLLPLGCIGFSVFCFVKYSRAKSEAIVVEKPKLRDRALRWAPYLMGAPVVGLLVATSSFSDYLVYAYLVFMLFAVLFLVLMVYKAKKNYKAIEHVCAFYESYLFFSYKALEMLVQKGVPYAVCYAQEVDDAFYVQIPAERNGLRSTNPYYDCIILGKQYLAPDQTETLRELLTRTFGDKFRQFNQN